MKTISFIVFTAFVSGVFGWIVNENEKNMKPIKQIIEANEKDDLIKQRELCSANLKREIKETQTTIDKQLKD